MAKVTTKDKNLPLTVARRILTHSIALTVLAALTGEAQELKPEHQWFQCEVDEDCVHIKYSCAEGVVNKKYARLADRYYALENARTECYEVPRGKTSDEEQYRIYCEARQCKARGRRPAPPGFS